jgi:hypothetical protein
MRSLWGRRSSSYPAQSQDCSLAGRAHRILGTNKYPDMTTPRGYSCGRSTGTSRCRSRDSAPFRRAPFAGRPWQRPCALQYGNRTPQMSSCAALWNLQQMTSAVPPRVILEQELYSGNGPRIIVLEHCTKSIGLEDIEARPGAISSRSTRVCYMHACPFM